MVTTLHMSCCIEIQGLVSKLVEDHATVYLQSKAVESCNITLQHTSVTTTTLQDSAEA